MHRNNLYMGIHENPIAILGLVASYDASSRCPESLPRAEKHV
jgi:hypothetical protein